uniref:MARVEL domain-containing protein n=1 Tax=Strongyloides papillosus TaxID=174720 RepID=A0A0N5BIB8_STREA
MFQKKEIEEIRESYSPIYEEFLQYHESIIHQSLPLKNFKDECELVETRMIKTFTKDVCDEDEELPYIGESGCVNFEAHDSSLVVSSEIDEKCFDSIDSDTEMEKSFKKRDEFTKKVHFEDDGTEYDNLRDNICWWLDKKRDRRKSYEEMIPLSRRSSKDDVEKYRKEDITNLSTRKTKLSICLRILKYFFSLLLILIPLFLFLLAFFGFGLCDIKPTVPNTLYFIGSFILLLFILTILLSLDWSPPIAIFLVILLIIVSIILTGLAAFVTYWFSDFYYLLQQQPAHCPTLYCSDRSVFSYVVAIILSWFSLGIIIYLNRKNFPKVFNFQ